MTPATFRITEFNNNSSISTEEFMTGKVNVNASRDKKKPMPVLFTTDMGGNVVCRIPDGTPPDTRAYNENRARQMQRKSKVVARLRARLEKKE